MFQVLPASADNPDNPVTDAKVKLGKILYFDNRLSKDQTQSCNTCHDLSTFGVDNEPTSDGDDGSIGTRNSPTVLNSALHTTQFWDGRANSLEGQALGPPLNPLEMANPDTLSIQVKLQALEYADRFISVYGEGALDDPGKAFWNMADAIAAYERSWEFNRFDSKYDHFLRGEAELTDQEIRGMGLFISENKGNCAACHPSTASRDGTPPLFTDFTYDNLGVPKNPENPYYSLSPELNPDGFDYIDLGLAITVNDPGENGKFRVPTLRNVAITAPYMHNGIFKTLFEVVAFYNTRDLGPWPPPEVPENVNYEELGDLKLSNQEIEDLVAFLETLTDGWTGKAP
jgi:cytochrome c peroxidase